MYCAIAPAALSAAPEGLSFHAAPIGRAAVGESWITNVRIVDLDQDGLMDALACDGRLNKVSWIRQAEPGVYREQDLGELVAGPVRAEAADIDADGDLDVLVASMGTVVPNNERIGSVVILENLGGGAFANRVVAERVPRVCYVGAGDLDEDGDLDLSVALFGFIDGEIRWMENRGDWNFTSHELLGYSGAIHTPICDLERDGDNDIVALVSQDWEEVHAFRNAGGGAFEGNVVYGSLNKNFGSSGIGLGDIDGDGAIDIAYTNGDGLDYATPGPRSWHGLQWLENDGAGSFRYHRIADLPGAHSPVVADVDGDGASDILAVSGFNDWSQPEAASVALFRQKRPGEFEPIVLAREPTHLVTLDAADMDGDGEIEFVTGAFMYYPPFDKKSRVTIWDRRRRGDD